MEYIVLEKTIDDHVLEVLRLHLFSPGFEYFLPRVQEMPERCSIHNHMVHGAFDEDSIYQLSDLNGHQRPCVIIIVN